MRKRRRRPTPLQVERAVRDEAIVKLYKSAKYTTERVAEWYSLTPRSVQRILRARGVIRPQAESNRLMAKHKHYHRIPADARVNRYKNTLLQRVRFKIISEHPYCTVCGMTADDGIRLEVDHIDGNATNNDLSNLQVLCQRCNIGKSHLSRWGIAA